MLSPNDIRVTTFGGLSLSRRDVVLDSFASRRSRTLLARLVLSTRPVLRTTMADFLWPEDFPDSTQNRLRTELYRLRSLHPMLQDLIQSDRETISLKRSQMDLDLRRFEAKLQIGKDSRDPEQRLTSLSEALRIADEEWLTHETEDWFEAERQRIIMLKANAFLDASRVAEELGDIPQARSFSESCVSYLPHFGSGVERLIEVLTAENATTEAIRVFSRYEELVTRRFGVPVDPKVQRLVQRLHDFPAPQPSKATPSPALPILPIDLVKVFGRDTDIERLGAWLSPVTPAERRLINILGPAGMGKTTLAQAIAAQMAAAYDGRVAFVDLSQVTDPTHVVERVGEVIVGSSFGEAEKQLRRQLGPEPVLLILDNLEQVSGVDAPLESLLTALPNARIVTTSRKPIRSPREQRYPLEPLNFSHESSPAALLLLAQFRLRTPGYEPTDIDLSAISELARRLNGHPLALVLAGSRGNVFSPTEMLHELDRGLGWIVSDIRLTKQDHQALDQAFAGTLAQLSDEARKAFFALAMFEGEWLMDAAVDYLQVVDNTQSATIIKNSVFELIDLSLVTRRNVDGESRFSLPLIFREFLFESGVTGTPELNQQFATWFVEALKSTYDSAGLPTRESMRRLNILEANFKPVEEWCRVHDPGSVTVALALLAPHWYNVKRSRRYAPLVESWMAANPPGPVEWVAEAWSGLAQLHSQAGSYDRARVASDRAVQLFRQLDDTEGILRTTRAEMHISYNRFQFDEVLRLCDQALDIAKRSPKPIAINSYRINRALALANLDRGREAIEALDDLLVDLKREGDETRILLTRISAAYIRISLRDWEHAEAALWELIREFNQAQEHTHRADCYTYLANIALRVGDYDEAKRRLDLAYEFVAGDEDAFLGAYRLYLRCLIAVQQKDKVTAYRLCRQLLSTWGEAESAMSQLMAIELAAFVLASFDQTETARQLLTASADVRRSAGYIESPFYSMTREAAEALVKDVPSVFVSPNRLVAELVEQSLQTLRASE